MFFIVDLNPIFFLILLKIMDENFIKVILKFLHVKNVELHTKLLFSCHLFQNLNLSSLLFYLFDCLRYTITMLLFIKAQ